MTGAELVRAARGLIGVAFRLHGRDPQHGLDCIGVLEAACVACGLSCRLPNAYTLRSRSLPPLAPLAARLGLREADGEIAAGDVLLLRPHSCQYHLAIAAGGGWIIHAHAGLRRVVEGPLPAAWPLAGRWRPIS